MKTYRRLFELLASFENLCVAYHAARRGKRSSPQVPRFELRWEEELLAIRSDLLSGTYRFGGYNVFVVHEPKSREVAAAPFRDRVVHHALIQVLEPVYEPRLIHDTYACRARRGTHRAILRCQEHVRRYPFALKADIWKFYPTVDHDVLLEILSRRVKDPRVMTLCYELLASWRSGQEYYWPVPGDDLLSPLRSRGIPIGNLTSQFFANLYLAEMDSYIKRTLRVRPYVRYMDDFLLFADDRETLHGWKGEVDAALASIRLRLHPTKCHLLRTADGVPFLGFRILANRRRLLGSGVRRFTRRTRRQIREVQRGERSAESLSRSVRGWITHASFAESEGLRRSILPRLVLRGKGGRIEPSASGYSGRFVEQRHNKPPMREPQQQQPDEPEQQQRFSLREDVCCQNPTRRGVLGRALDVHDSFPAREGRIAAKGPPRGRRTAEARRPLFYCERTLC